MVKGRWVAQGGGPHAASLSLITIGGGHIVLFFIYFIINFFWCWGGEVG